MATSIQHLKFGDSEIRVSVVLTPGTQNTSSADRIRDRAVDALEEAQLAIQAVAQSATHTVNKLKSAATSPSNVEIELGLAFTAQGNVVVAGAGVQASIVVHLTYELNKTPSTNR
jgi:Trypsin-co-occurring domain 1